MSAGRRLFVLTVLAAIAFATVVALLGGGLWGVGFLMGLVAGSIITAGVEAYSRRLFKRLRENCKTPEAIYKIHVGDGEVIVGVDLPEYVELDEQAAREIESQIYDALEAVLAPYFRSA